MIVKSLNSKLDFLVCLLICYLFISNMVGVYSTYLPFHDLLYFIIFVLSCFLLINQLKTVHFRNKYFVNLLLLFGILILLTSAYFYFFRLDDISFYSVRQLIDSVLWILFLLNSYLFAYQKGESSIKCLRYLLLLLPIFLVLYIQIKSFSDNRGIPEISSVYYLLFLLPFLFLEKKKIYKIIGFFIIFIAILLSVKRTGIIALVIFLIIYYYINNKQKQKSTRDIIKNVLLTSVVVAIIGAGLYWIIQNYDIDIIIKLQNMSEDGGSGRTEVWGEVISMIIHSNPIALLFGHGFNSVYYDSVIGLSAHSDFLEVIYDYGILGFLMYMKLWFYLFTNGIKLYKRKSAYAPVFLASLGMAFFFSLTSHLIIYPTYFLFLCLFWGSVLGIIYNDRRGNNDKIKCDYSSI